jgi:hypothetical protein
MKRAPERDYRLDFCRGLALLMIFIDHVPGNPAGSWTLRNYAFCDAAEVFVLISGISAYLAYASKFERLGFRGGAAAIGQRWIKIYCAHILLFFLVAGFVALVSFLLDEDFASFLRMSWLFNNPTKAAVAAVTLQYLPAYLDILPLYLFLIAMTPGLIPVVKRAPWATIALSLLLYAAARSTGFNLNAGNDGSHWYFNPLAWQLLFTAGIVLGYLSRTPSTVIPQNKHLLSLALGFVGFGFAAAAPWNGPDTGLAFFSTSVHLWPAEKTFLAPLRLINVLALAYVFAFFVKPQAAFFKTKFATPVIACGQHSLWIYCFGVLLSVAGYVAVTESGEQSVVYAAVNLVGVLLHFLMAGALTWLPTRLGFATRSMTAPPKQWAAA